MSLRKRSRIPALTRRFFAREDASVSMEVVVLLPLLLWGYMGLFVLYDGYRSLHNNLNAAHTIADLISRETEGITSDYVEGLNSVQDVLTQAGQDTVLRISVVSYDGVADQHNLEWSYATAGKEAVGSGAVGTDLVPYLPIMYNGEHLIVVETWANFQPLANLSIGWRTDEFNVDDEGEARESDAEVFPAFTFEGLAVTRPRFAGQLCWETCDS
jgi:hypothetical protein